MKRFFSVFCVCLMAFTLTGCGNSQVTADPSGNIPLTKFDTKNKLSRITAEIIATETAYSPILVEMVQPTADISDNTYASLVSGVKDAIEKVNNSIIEIDSFVCPETMTQSRDKLKEAANQYLAILNNLKEAGETKNIESVKAQYTEFKNIVSALQSIQVSL